MAKNQSAVQKEATAVSVDMRDLYQEFKSGKVERDAADTLANIAGKNLKALSIIVADQMREDGHLALAHRTKTLPGAGE